ncbi:MAG: hypothetical protein NVV59_04130 [Chitinophagaceae bacterium]|nr:hypothetical protein [Chitinophagaceae bacterium]
MMMYSELRKYLLLHQELPIPGIGTLMLERQPASFDFPNRQILPPSYQVGFREGQVQPSRRLYDWLAQGLGISERDAIMRFNDFVFELRERLNKGEKLEWQGIGQLNKGLGGVWHFKPETDSITEGEPIHADKVLRDQASHSVRVGEDERTSEQMRAYLQADPARKNVAWALALVLLIISFIILGIYLSSNGLKPASSGNKSKIKTESSPQPPRYL